MADDIVTNRLRTSEVSAEDDAPTGDTVELEEIKFMETAQLKKLLSPVDESDDESEDEIKGDQDWTWVS